MGYRYGMRYFAREKTSTKITQIQRYKKDRENTYGQTTHHHDHISMVMRDEVGLRRMRKETERDRESMCVRDRDTLSLRSVCYMKMYEPNTDIFTCHKEREIENKRLRNCRPKQRENYIYN